MPERLAIAVLTGGYSEEAPISRKSAAMVMNHIDADRFDATLVHVDPDGWWAEIDHARVPFDHESFTVAGKNFDGAFIVIHGTPGEDGRIQAQLEALNIPHTTGDAKSMAMTFHKGKTTDCLREHQIAVAQSIHIENNESWDGDAIEELIGFPCFVKPNEAGSSFGVSLVETRAALSDAIQKALGTGEGGALVETLLHGREFTIGVIPDEQGSPMALPVTEIRTDRTYFDYEAKYGGESEETTPANIDDSVREEMQAQAIAVYKTTACRGMARIDSIWVNREVPTVIEVNGIPGFSEVSISPKQAEAAGISKTALITRIIEQTILKK